MSERASGGSIVEIAGIRVGHAQDAAARTGCSVVLMPEAGVVCGVDVRGSAPGTRETDLLAPTAHLEVVHAIVLAGGSAYGLDAAGGVMAYLEEHDVGYAVGPWRIPIVPAAIIFDLYVGDGRVRPDRKMGYDAACAATGAAPREGAIGVGAGATVAKLAGLERRLPGGVGNASVRFDGLVVGALAVSNSVGGVYDPWTGEPVAVPHADDGAQFDLYDLLAHFPLPATGTNTTLAVVATNARLRKVDATKVAQMAHDGLARVIRPAHLTRDGDAIFACATSEIEARVDLVGAMAADAVAEAIVRGVRAAQREDPAHR